MTLGNLFRFGSVLALAAAGLLAGCSGGSFDSSKLGGMLGPQGQELLTAAGHEKSAMTLSEKDEDGIGQAVGVRLCTEYGVYDKQRMLKYVTLVGLTVASASSNPGGNYVFGILDTNEINAFSGPNGYIFMTRGALEQMKDEAELAGVLAHEISHVCHHDGLKQVRLAEQQGAITSAISATKADQFAQFADTGIEAITKKGYSQPQEFAADDSGVKIMNDAGYDPRSYLAFLQRLAKLQSTGGGTVMSTHPGINDRVAKVQKEIAGMGKLSSATLADRFAENVNFSAAAMAR